MPGGRAFAASNTFLTLDGVKCGPVRSASGGVISAMVATDSSGSGGFPKKRLSGTQYEPFVLEVGLGMEAPVYDWAAKLWTADFPRRSGSLVTADYKLEAKHQREFVDALLTETSFPALDASAKDAGFVTLKFSAELIRETSASGKQNGAGKKEKQWLRSGFRLQIDNLDCTKVSKIEPISVKTAVVVDAGGAGKPTLEPTKLEFSNLQITLSEVSSKTWFDWFEDFAIKGNNDDSAERNGTIQLLAADAKTELARIKLFGLGIFRIAAAAETRGDKQKLVTAELYCGRMELDVKQ